MKNTSLLLHVYLTFSLSIPNLNISLPNNGYNSSNIEIGCTYQI